MSAIMGGKDIWVVCETAPGAEGSVLASSLDLMGEAAVLARSADRMRTGVPDPVRTFGGGFAEDSPREVVALVCTEGHSPASATGRPGPGTGIFDELTACGADRIIVLELPCAVGPGIRPEIGTDCAAEHGAERDIRLGDPCSAERGPEYLEDSAFARAIAGVAAREKPDIILMAATVFGRSVMPRLAARLRTGLTADCTALRLEEDGTLVQTRPAYGANLLAEVVCGGAGPQMATVRPGVFGKPEREARKCARIVRMRAESTADPTAEFAAGAGMDKRTEERPEEGNAPGSGAFPLLRLLQRDFDADSGSDLSTARVIVAGGKGVGSKGGFAALERLAAILGGAVGATRSAVEAGYAPYPMQVGQTGRTIRPEIYIACGISGSIQHLAGMSGSGYVIAINADRNAPIFDHADYGIVGDLGLVVDAMIGILEKGAKKG